MKKILLIAILLASIQYTFSQEKQPVRGITPAEYEKAKTFSVKDLDNDTYVKFENAYILDRYESRKPYYITGDDGLKKRIDLYKLIAKDSMKEIGVLIFYTNEKNQLFKACLPSFASDGKVWEHYFEDIHAIDKIEKNFVLKLSYVLSKELGFQLYKSANAGKDISKESATYGNDICFPGDMLVTMSDGQARQMKDLRAGDKIQTIDPFTKKTSVVTIEKLNDHSAKNYAVTTLTLLKVHKSVSLTGTSITMSSKLLEATPNHPLMAGGEERRIADVKEGDSILCFDEKSGAYESFIVWNKTESGGGIQKVYNIETSSGSTFLVNGVMVLKKSLRQ